MNAITGACTDNSNSQNVPHNDGVSFLDMFMSLSTALDMVNVRFGNHHKLTCYIAACMHHEISDDQQAYEKLFASAMVHDIGASYLADRLALHEYDENLSADHAYIGESILESVEPLVGLAQVVGDHHVIWDWGRGECHNGRSVNPISHVIQLADRVAVQINQTIPLPGQAMQIRDRIKDGAGKLFPPHLVEAFCDLSVRPSFWLEMDTALLDNSIRKLSSIRDARLSFEELENLSKVYAFIIDSRSRFTASHSSGVAVVAQALALAHGLDEEQSLQVKIAGYLHDIGKLSVPGEILEKPGQLNEEERLVMNGHSFYTKKILHNVDGMGDIEKWASQHHEFIDGSGYPYGLVADQLCIESRILAIADIFTALTEDRPYRQGLELSTCLGMLENFGQRGKIDLDILSTLESNADEINLLRQHTQYSEDSKLTNFRKNLSERLQENAAKGG